MPREQPLKVLLVGQVPPPYHGQAVMISQLMNCTFEAVQRINLPLRFSEGIEDIGKVRIAKVWHLLRVILKIIVLRFRHGISVLYYPPAGPDRIPVLRDIALLLTTRWLFRRTVFHFHAAGVSEIYPRLSPLLRVLFRWAYFDVDMGIQLSDRNPPDATLLRARQVLVIPYGIDDRSPAFRRSTTASREPPVILFVGILCESKGLLVLLEAVQRLRQEGYGFRVRLIGGFQTRSFEEQVVGFIEENQLRGLVELPGVLSGDSKWQAYADADVFCFPSFYELESFGLVVLEAMQFGLPVVATNWRGIADLVEEGETGFLVPVRNAVAVAGRLRLLLGDPILRSTLGGNGRRRFLERFTAERYARDMEKAFLGLCGK